MDTTIKENQRERISLFGQCALFLSQKNFETKESIHLWYFYVTGSCPQFFRFSYFLFPAFKLFNSFKSFGFLIVLMILIVLFPLSVRRLKSAPTPPLLYWRLPSAGRRVLTRDVRGLRSTCQTLSLYWRRIHSARDVRGLKSAPSKEIPLA